MAKIFMSVRKTLIFSSEERLPIFVSKNTRKVE